MSEGQTDDYGKVCVFWLRCLRASGLCSYHGQPHRTDQRSLTWYYVVEVISTDEMVEKRRSNQQLIQKNGGFRHMSGPIQTSAHTPTHTQQHKMEGQPDTRSVNQRGASWSLFQITSANQSPLDWNWICPILLKSYQSPVKALAGLTS